MNFNCSPMLCFRKLNNCARKSKRLTLSYELFKGLAWALCKAFLCQDVLIVLIAMITILGRIGVRHEVVVDPIEVVIAWVLDPVILATAIVAAMKKLTEMTLEKNIIAEAATATVINFKVEEDRTARWEIIRN